MMNRWHPLLQTVLDLVLESPCSLCQRATSEVVCPYCQRQMQACQWPGTQFPSDPFPIVAWGSYGGSLKRAIAALKYDRQARLATPLGHWLADAWLASPWAKVPVIVVPIPMHTNKQQQRGYNQAELLAIAFCQRTGLPLKRRGLARRRSTDAQFGLSAEARSHNLKGAFDLGQDFQHQRPQRPVLLLDDIYTTGATIQAACATLHLHQIPVHGVATLARAILNRPTP